MKAIILLSGGVDSTVILALAKQQGKECHTISFDYGQRHRLELRAAKNIAKFYGVPHQLLKVDMNCLNKSSLTSNSEIPKDCDLEKVKGGGIPSTYVPARNTIFLSYALGYAECMQANEIHFGANKDDYSPYPDCRPEYFEAFQKTVNMATKQSIEQTPPLIITPLIYLTKVEIVQKGKELNAPLNLTLSCYDPFPFGEHCGSCLACKIRKQAFQQ